MVSLSILASERARLTNDDADTLGTITDSELELSLSAAESAIFYYEAAETPQWFHEAAPRAAAYRWRDMVRREVARRSTPGHTTVAA